ncbi:hypothetical protein SAMN05216588_11820 [Pseudomonas flavescens]|uniref:LysR substrate binding domain-containing protein n=1 Tax=Phytopseudomonas flavescens TaxID=29435 RepID=A0A1G8L3E7_9GAMM|nr:hypothetical protein SAMN05216588_11820 [Pseudomonas flavescens]
MVSRSTHAVRATPAGLAFAERARRILAELHLGQAIADFLTAYPGLDVQLRLIDSFIDLHGARLGEVDLGLRTDHWPIHAWSPPHWRQWFAWSVPARPTWLVSEYLARGELARLFCENGLPAPEPSGIYALRLERDTDSRSRLLLAFLKNRFGPIAPWGIPLQSGVQRGARN